jgi:hypothetical protein
MKIATAFAAQSGCASTETFRIEYGLTLRGVAKAGLKRARFIPSLTDLR